MSEFNPFAASDETPEHVADEVAEDSGSKRNVVALGALAAVALGAGAFIFLGGSGDDFEEFVPAATAPAAAAPAAAPGQSAKLPAASKLTLGRNPFRALYVQPAAAADTSSSGGSVTAPAPVAPAPVVVVPAAPAPAPFQPAPAQPAPFQPAPAQPAPAQPAPAQPAPAPAPQRQSTVALKSVAAGKDGSNPTATFNYDGKTVSGAPGDVMDGKLLVISIQQDNTGGWYANLQLGDGDPFEVHERQTVVVQ